MADGPVDSLHSRRPEEAGSGSPSRELTEAPSPGAGQAASDPSVSLSGTTVDHFEVLELLGAGGFGEVYRARDTRLGRMVAIKVLPAAFAKDAERRERFRREALAASALNHPNICTVHDLVEEDGRYFIVMELVEGKTLAATLKDGPLSLERLLPIALQVAEALGEAHRAGILHRDIKPGNIALTARGQVKVLDFGLAKLVGSSTDSEEPTLESLTAEGATFGTLEYMSPEQLLGKPLDRRSDLFSFGIVLYAMMTARLPFRASAPIALANAILHAEPRDFGVIAVPERLKAVIRKLLEKEPGKRYASAEDLHRDLASLIESPGAKRTAALSRGAWIGVATVTVVLVAAAGWLWSRAARERRVLAEIPEITQLVENQEYETAASLLRKARSVLPNDPALEKLWMKSTDETDVVSAPAGATVSIRPYRGDPEAWETLGVTPLKGVHVPKSGHLWRLTKAGFVERYWLGLGSLSYTKGKTIPLDPAGSIPAGMVRVLGPKGMMATPVLGLEPVAEFPMQSFLIDRTEVTNEEFRKFVEAGGYRRKEFWKQPFVRGGRTLPWEEAAALLVDATGQPGPATWEAGTFPGGQEKHPVAGVSWYEAAAYAEFASKSLPTIYHWYYAADEWFTLIAPASNFRGKGTLPVEGDSAVSGWGTRHMAGNVKEWCWNETTEGKRFILGGGFGEPEYMFWDPDAQSPWDRKPNYGFRCVKLPAPPSPVAVAKVGVISRDFERERPVSDEVFKAYRGLYAYDKGNLDARVERSEAAGEWSHEVVSFKAAYGGERVLAHLFLPKSPVPPYQSVILFPGDVPLYQDKLDQQEFSEEWAYYLTSGRAVMFPVYKGMFERRDGFESDQPEATALYRDHVIAWAKDLGRSVDYLETRPDVDRQKLAYSGTSMGGDVAPVLLALETRFRAAIVIAGGMVQARTLPEVDRINFIGRVKVPTLMLNGRYDFFFPVERSILPMFRLLGTPEKDKKLVLYDSGHMPPRTGYIRESLAWLDRYLGPVKK